MNIGFSNIDLVWYYLIVWCECMVLVWMINYVVFKFNYNVSYVGGKFMSFFNNNEIKILYCFCCGYIV